MSQLKLNCSALEDIYNMDFTQMRALEGSEKRHRATDNAIKYFVEKLNEFFSQFQNLPKEVGQDLTLKEAVANYAEWMEKIINKINISERNYYKKKYESSDTLEENHLNSYLNTFNVKLNKLPDRMQHWAASYDFGDSIRNPVEHRKAKDFLNKWFGYISEIEQKKDNFVLQEKVNDGFYNLNLFNKKIKTNIDEPQQERMFLIN